MTNGIYRQWPMCIDIYYIHLTQVFLKQVCIFIFEFDPYADRKSMDKNADFFPYPKIAQPTDFCRFVFLAYGLIFCLNVKNFTLRIFFSLP